MGTEEDLLLAFPSYREAAHRLAAALSWPYGEVSIHAFPDGESRVRLPKPLPRRVVFCLSLDWPNAKLTELLLAAATARTLGVAELWLVAPYLCYMRQDKAFTAGEAVSQQVVGALLARSFDAVITVDPHLHRVSTLKEAVPVREARAVSAAPAIAEYLRAQGGATLLVGPDEESAQWARRVASLAGLEYVVGTKRRTGDRLVEVVLPPGEYRGRHVVMLDDVVSTGQTLVKTAIQLAAHGPASLAVVVTHALFVEDAVARLRQAGVGRIISTDAVPHETNEIPLAPLLAAEILEIPRAL